MPNVLGLSNEERWYLYLVCEKHGHAGVALGSLHTHGQAWQFCTRCGTEYAEETVIRTTERNPPVDPGDDVEVDEEE